MRGFAQGGKAEIRREPPARLKWIWLVWIRGAELSCDRGASTMLAAIVMPDPHCFHVLNYQSFLMARQPFCHRTLASMLEKTENSNQMRK